MTGYGYLGPEQYNRAEDQSDLELSHNTQLMCTLLLCYKVGTDGIS